MTTMTQLVLTGEEAAVVSVLTTLGMNYHLMLTRGKLPDALVTLRLIAEIEACSNESKSAVADKLGHLLGQAKFYTERKKESTP